jgi:predicted nucleic acid-binding protein
MPPALGLDSSVLSAFARAERLDLLERLTGGRRRVVTEAVLAEIDRGCPDYPPLANVRSLPWLEVVRPHSPVELGIANEYIRILGSNHRNVGESSILAWAETTSNMVAMDDDDAVRAARKRKVVVLRTLTLLCNGLHKRILTVEQACTLVDELVTVGGARFPCDGASFVQWAERNGLLPAG